MNKLSLKSSYDVVVIGAGVGGLTAAALLSKAGFSVCVLEKEPHVGGYLAGFHRKDFRFDTAIHWLNQCAPDGLVGKMFAFLGKDHPPAVAQKRIRRYKGKRFDHLLTNDPEQWKNRLIKEFPQDRDGIIRFFRAAYRMGHSFAHYSRIFRSEETMSFSERLKNKFRLLAFALPFIPYLRYSGEKGLDHGLRRFFQTPALREIFASETELLACLIPIGWAYFGDFQSPPAGGGQVIPEWLQHIVTFYENPVHCRARVTRILLDQGRCQGVEFEHRGLPYSVRSKYVIAACDVEALYERMLPPEAIPEKLKIKLRKAELYSSSVTVSIALDCPAEALGLNEELVHVVDEDLPFDAHHSGNPDKSELSVLAPSLRDKSLAPAGQGTLVLFMPAFMDFHDHWLAGRDGEGNYVMGNDYRKLKTEVAEKIIDRIAAQVAPDLRAHILFYDVATPVTHFRYTGNRDGTMMGAKPGRENMQRKVAHYRTPVPNLILGGHWAELGGGVPIAVKAGSNAALLVLKKERRKAFRALADYMDDQIRLDELRRHPDFKSYDDSWVPRPTPAQRHALPKQVSTE